MGIFEHFPYTNFHDLNLDKILERTQEAEEAVETSAQQVQDAASDMAAASAAAANAVSVANGAVSTANTAATSAAQAATSAAVAVTTAQQAVANKVIPMLWVSIYFDAPAGSRISWYDGSVDGEEITTWQDLNQFLRTGSDGVSNSKTSIMNKVAVSGYPTSAASYVVYNASFINHDVSGRPVYYIICDIPYDGGAIHRLILKIDAHTAFNDFTYTDITIA